MDDDSLLRLRWNSHTESLQALFENLLEQQVFVDVTLCCDGGVLRAHRVMLSACSAYFRRVLHETQCKHPVIIMRDVAYAHMDSILQFIYRGEIHVKELRLAELLRTARLLQIRGLSDHHHPMSGSEASSDGGAAAAAAAAAAALDATPTAVALVTPVEALLESLSRADRKRKRLNGHENRVAAHKAHNNKQLRKVASFIYLLLVLLHRHVVGFSAARWR